MHAVASASVKQPEVSAIICSSEFSVRTDDKLKDEDNAGWLLTLLATEQADWLAVLKWIRLPDRLVDLLSTVVPSLLQRASRLLQEPGLCASWCELRHQVRMRHSRIEYVARRCRFNSLAFQREYWALVEQDLAKSPQVA